MEMYKCRKCGTEFPRTPEGLTEYRKHCLSHINDNKDEDSVANALNDAKISDDENVQNDEPKTVDNDGENDIEAEEKEEKSGGYDEDVHEADDLKKRKKEAMEKNSCRGYAEGNKEYICKRYLRCTYCWADFK